jgi:hypothetical protein
MEKLDFIYLKVLTCTFLAFLGLTFLVADQVQSLMFKLVHPKRKRFLALGPYFHGQN